MFAPASFTRVLARGERFPCEFGKARLRMRFAHARLQVGAHQRVELAYLADEVPCLFGQPDAGRIACPRESVAIVDRIEYCARWGGEDRGSSSAQMNAQLTIGHAPRARRQTDRHVDAGRADVAGTDPLDQRIQTGDALTDDGPPVIGAVTTTPPR